MSINQAETISTQPETSEKPESANSPETLQNSAEGQSQSVEDANLIPEKFIGKSAYEISQSYREIEKDRGRLASELGAARKEQEELRKQFLELQQAAARFNSMPTQVPPQASGETEKDPFSVFDEKFEEDPKAAIRAALESQAEMVRRQARAQTMQQMQQEAQEYYLSQKKENPDYARREPIMQRLVAEFQDVIKPEHFNSKKVLQALDLMSRGADLEHYTREAATKAQKNGSSVREEKRRAQSESASSEGEQLKEFSKLSTAEMRKLLSSSED